MDPTALNRLVQTISVDRFATYQAAADGDAKVALALYRWNIAISAAFYGPLHMIEVALRNRLNDRLTQHFGRPDWWNGSRLTLTVLHQRTIVDAMATASQGGRQATPGHIVAELSFGFWVGLLGPGRGRGYEMTLWRPILRHAFPGYRGVRAALHSDFDRRRTFRNRVAHHEPIFQRNLSAEYAHIVRLTRLIEPDAADWLLDGSRVQAVLALRPHPGFTPDCKF